MYINQMVHNYVVPRENSFPSNSLSLPQRKHQHDLKSEDLKITKRRRRRLRNPTFKKLKNISRGVEEILRNTHIQERQRNQDNMIRRKRTWPDFSPCYSTNRKVVNSIAGSSAVPELPEDNESRLDVSSIKTCTNSEATGRMRDSSGSCPAWSIGSLMAIFPASPSPICSPLSSKSCSPSTDIFYSLVSTEFSTPRNQFGCGFPSNSHPRSSCTLSSKRSTSSIEIDERKDILNDQCGSYQLSLESNGPKEGEDVKRDYSPKSVNASIHPALSQALPVVNEELEEQSSSPSSNSRHVDLEMERPTNGFQRLMTRPKPFHAFLDEIKKKEREGRVNEWKEAKQLKLMDKLRSKEAAINEWEFKQTTKAMNKVKELESNLQMKRMKAIEETQKQISIIHRKANKLKVRERCSTIRKISRDSEIEDKIEAIQLKFLNFC